MKIILKILNWIFSLFCMTVLPVYGFHIGSMIILAIGIITLPIKFFVNLRSRIPLNKFAKIGIYVVLFVVGILLLPTESTTQESSSKELEVSTEVASDDKKIGNSTSAEQNTTEKITEGQTTEKQITKIKTTEEQTVETGITEPKTIEDQTTENQITETQTIEEQTSEEQITTNQITEEQTTENEPVGTSYVLNTSTGKFHKPNCSTLGTMKDSNREDYYGTRDEVIGMGYSPCGRCNP